MGQHGQELVLAAVGLRESFLRLLNVSDVERAANVPQKSPIGCEAGQTRRLHPAVFPILTPQAKLRLEWRSLLERLPVSSLERLGIVGMQRSGPLHPLNFFHRPPDKLQVFAVHELAAVEPVNPNQHRGGVGQQPEPLLALSQRLFGLASAR